MMIHELVLPSFVFADTGLHSKLAVAIGTRIKENKFLEFPKQGMKIETQT